MCSFLHGMDKIMCTFLRYSRPTAVWNRLVPSYCRPESFGAFIP